MYMVSEVLDIGEAHEFILADFKCESITDDTEPVTFSCEEVLDSVTEAKLGVKR